MTKNLPETINIDTGLVKQDDLKKAMSALDLAELFEVDSTEMYESAAVQVKLTKELYKELDVARKSITKPMDQAKKATMDFFRPYLDALTKAEGLFKRGMLGWERKLEEERRRIEEEARQAAEAERKRLQEEAKKAEQSGDIETADAAKQQAAMVRAPVVNIEKPKVEGVSTREIWSAEVTDKMELIKAVAAGQIPDTVLNVDMTVLNGLARSLKSKFKYPGVRAVATKSMAVG